MVGRFFEKKKYPNGYFLLRSLVERAVRARHEASGLVAMDDMLLRGLCGCLLKLLHGLANFCGLAFLEKGFPVSFEGFDVRLQARVASSAAVVLTQIFDGGVFIWHRECQNTIQRRSSRQYVGFVERFGATIKEWLENRVFNRMPFMARGAKIRR